MVECSVVKKKLKTIKKSVSVGEKWQPGMVAACCFTRLKFLSYKI